jgi:WD40 repeat protein
LGDVMPISDSEQLILFDQLAEEFADRCRQGERPSLTEYVDRLPQMAGAIREMFPALVEVEQVEGDARKDALNHKRPSVPPLTELGDYRIVREIGHGGMGVVYEAEQVSLGRRVALKVLPGHVVGDRKVLERFRREAKAAARLHHTNIVPVFEIGHEGRVAFYTMQFIQGQGLDQVIDELRRLRDPDRKPVGKNHDFAESWGPVRHAVTFSCTSGVAARQRNRAIGEMAESLLSGQLGTGPLKSAAGGVSETLAATCSDEPFNQPAIMQGVSREMVRGRPGYASAATAPGSAVLPGGTAVSTVDSSARRLPFFRSVAQIGRQAAQGLAYAHARGVVHRDIKPSNLLLDTAGVVWITDFGLAKSDDEGLTATGDILGTLRYMAPERFHGGGDARADIYALGLTVYELLTLRAAFDTSDRLKLVERINAEEPERPRGLDSRIPRDLETIVLKAIDKNPVRRYATADAMAEDLRRFLADEPIHARRTTIVERYWLWARRNPAIAVLGAVLTAMLIVATAGSLIVAGRMASLARKERSSSLEASRRATAESAARADAESARTAALAETYRATLSEARALRAGRQSGWRDEVLSLLARLAASPSSRRSLLELRTEAVAALATPDVRLVARIESAEGLRSFAFATRGQTLLTAGSGRGLDLWNVQELKHAGAVTGLAVCDSRWARRRVLSLPRGQGFAVATRDHGVVFTDSTGTRSSRPPITRGPHPPVQLATDSEGRRIAIAWANRSEITVHNMADGRLLGEFPASPFTLSPDGESLAHVGPGGEVQLDRLGAKEPTKSLGHHDRPVAFAFSPDGHTLGCASKDRTAILIDVTGQTQPVVLRGHREALNELAFSPDGGWVATTSNDHTARIWDSLTGQLLATLPGPWFMFGVDWSPDGSYLGVSDENEKPGVMLYRVTGRRLERRLSGHAHGVQCVAAHPRLDRIATGADDHRVFVWSLETTQPSRQWSGDHPTYVMSAAYSPDGSLLATGAGDGTLLLRNADTGALTAQLKGHRNGVPSLAFDKSGRRLASGDVTGQVIVWDLSTMQPLQQLQVGPSWVWSIAFVDGGRKLVSEVSNGALVLFDLASGMPEAQVTLPGGIRRFLADQARNRLIVAFNNGDLCSLSLPGLTPGHRLEHAHPSAVESLALSPDGGLLASGGADRRVVIRDPATFEPLMAFPEWTGMVKDLAFTPSGSHLAFVGADSDIALWKVSELHEGLRATGLAWDQPAPAVVSTSGPVERGEPHEPKIPLIRPGKSAPVAFDWVDQ